MEELREGRQMLIAGIMEFLAKSVRQKVPEKGVFGPVSWAMRYYGTEHQGRLYVQYSPEHGCAIRASMIPEGTSREIANYVYFGSREACIAWLNDKSHIDELREIYDHLLERADEEC